MNEKSENNKLNKSVLGILIRVARIEQGYSLRSLSSLTDISHTLISNIEKGIQPPSDATLVDIFRVLKLKLYTSKEIGKEMAYFYKNILENLVNNQYEEAEKLVREMEKKANLYENSYEVINYFVIRCLFYTITDTFLDTIYKTIKQYEKVIEFFTDEQKQLFYFIMGLDNLNSNKYKQASEYFEKALVLGNKDLDVVIKEYLVVALNKQYKFIDSVTYAESTIEEFEEKTIYIRAMKCRLSIAKVYTQILKLDQAQNLIDYVESFANQFSIDILTNRCHILNAEIMFFKKEYANAVKELEQHTVQDSKHLILPKFRAYLMSKDKRLFAYYKDIMESKKDVIQRNEYLLIKVLMMWTDLEIRDDTEYVNGLNELINTSIEIHDQEVIGLTHNLLIDFYREKRKYKKALEIADSLLMHKKIHLSFYSIKND